METNRLRFVDLDESFGVKEVAPVTGFTVLKAPRGTAEPIFFPKGSRQDIVARIGAPHKDYPGIQEALDYNDEYNLWISAPPGIIEGKTNTYGGVYATTRGSLESFLTVTDPTLPNFNIYVTAKNAGSPYSAGSTVTSSAGGIVVDNIPVFFSTAVTAVMVSYPSLGNPLITTSLQLSVANGKLTLDSTEVGSLLDDQIIIDGDPSTPALNFENADLVNHLSLNMSKLVVSWVMNIESEVILTLYQTSPRASATEFSLKNVDVRTTVDGFTNPLYNTMTFSFTEDIGILNHQSQNFTLSPVYGAADGQGAPIFIEDILDGNFYIYGKAYKTFADTEDGVSWPQLTGSPKTALTAGTRLITGTMTEQQLASSLMEGWSGVSTNSSLANVALFMNIENTFDALAVFASLRQTTHKFSTFISGLRVSSSSTAAAITALKALNVPKTTGIAVYCNEFLVRETYYGTDYWTVPIGSIGKMLSRIINTKLGGWAPMYTNTGLNIGGQLDKAVKKQKYSFTADQLDELDAASINPIILDIDYGLMITSQKTCQSPQVLTDWSYLGHQMAFDLFKKEIRSAVMIPQIGKPIDGFYMDLRQQQAETILNQRLVGAKAIWADGVVLVHEVNTAETKAANKFVIKIRVKVNPFAEAVELVFNNVGQTSNV